MKEKHQLHLILKNCINRGCSPEQLQDFIDRARLYNIDRPEMIPLIDDLEVKYITSLGEDKEA